MATHTCEDGCWYVAHNDDDIWHVGYLSANGTVTTGQPNLETFASEQEALAIVPEQYRPED